MTPGQVAYEKWRQCLEYALQPWPALPANVRAIWERVAEAVIEDRLKKEMR